MRPTRSRGLQYAGFETFRGSPYTSCARETGQNSRDAASGKEPVIVAFDLLEVERSQVPFADELQHSIECCLKAPHDEKTQTHLERAHQKIAASTIKVLRISDLNTTGLTGPVDDPKLCSQPWLRVTASQSRRTRLQRAPLELARMQPTQSRTCRQSFTHPSFR